MVMKMKYMEEKKGCGLCRFTGWLRDDKKLMLIPCTCTEEGKKYAEKFIKEMKENQIK